MIDRVLTSEMLPQAITKHITPFCKSHFLVLDDVLLDYCKEIMDCSSGPFAQFSRWESRVLVLIDLIQNKTIQSDLVLDVMRRTPIPWSVHLGLVMDSMVLTGTRTHQEFCEQHKLMKLKAMTLRYGIKKFNVSDMKLAQRLVPFILKHVDVIEAVPDAIMCVDAYRYYSAVEVAILRCQFLVNARYNGRLDFFIKNGTEDEKMEVNLLGVVEREVMLSELNIWVEHKLNRMIRRKTLDPSLYASILEAAKIIATESDTRHLFDRCLQFGKVMQVISPFQIQDTSYSLRVIDKVFSENASTSTFAFKVGWLLGFSRHFMLSRSALYSAKEGNIEAVVFACNEMNDRFYGPATADYISEMIELLIPLLEDPFKALNVSENLLSIVRLAVRNSDRTNLESNYLCLLDRKPSDF